MNQNQQAVVLTHKLDGNDFELSITTRQLKGKEIGNKTRVYFHASGESIGEQLFNRHDRPYKLYRNFVPAVLKAAAQLLSEDWQKQRINDPSVKFGWDKHAGCTMCPCSPGFVLTTRVNVDIYVSIKSKKVNVKTVGKPVSLEHAARTMQDLKEGAVAITPEPKS